MKLLLVLLISSNSFALAPPPLNFEREFVEVKGQIYEVKNENVNGITTVSIKKEKRIDFFGGGGKPPIKGVKTGDEDQPFHEGDLVYFLSKLEHGIGVVKSVTRWKNIWIVKAEFKLERSTLVHISSSDKFCRAYQG